MTTYGVTPQGFVVKRLNDILSDLNVACEIAFGTSFDTDPDKPNGQINGIMAEVFADFWEQLNAVYDARDPAKAVGVALTDLGVINYLTRLNATRSTATVIVTAGPSGAFLPAAVAQIATTNPVNTFSFLIDVTIPPNGSVTAEVQANLTGPILAPAGTLVNIATPISGWLTVINPADAVPGQNYETDPEFRMRRNNSTLLNSQQIEDAILAALLNITGVVDAIVYKNSSDIIDSNGFLPHSIAAVVEGGADQAIGSVLYNKHTSSIPTNGDTEVDFPNNAGILIPVFFYRAVQVPVYIHIIVQAYAGFPGDGVTQIRQNVFNYLTGVSNGNVALFGIGDSVIRSQMYTPINYTQGVSVVSIALGTAPNPTSNADLPIAFNAYATFNINNILVQAV